jgi:hypothetical protein
MEHYAVIDVSLEHYPIARNRFGIHNVWLL